MDPEQKSEGIECGITTVGKKGRDFFKKRDFNLTASHVDVYGSVDVSFINQMTRQFIDMFLTDEVDEVYMMYSRFLGMARQEPTLVKLIPIEPRPLQNKTAVRLLLRDPRSALPGESCQLLVT